MKNWPSYCDCVGTTDNGGERLSPSSVPHANTSERTLLVNVTVQLTAHEPWGYAMWNGIGWLLETQVQLLGLMGFCLERPNGSTPNGTQHNMGWQMSTVTADSWLGHQNISFKAGLSPSHGGGSGFVKTSGILVEYRIYNYLYCICGIWLHCPSTYSTPEISWKRGEPKL